MADISLFVRISSMNLVHLWYHSGSSVSRVYIGSACIRAEVSEMEVRLLVNFHDNK
jgi:hypothetical protein